MERPFIKLYSFKENKFEAIAIVDDYESLTISHNKYSAGDFVLEINLNIPNANLFEKNQFALVGKNGFDFYIITDVSDSFGNNGKGSQKRIVNGKDCRYLLKRRIIKTLNFDGIWEMTAKGEICLRHLISDQCGETAEIKRRLPIINLFPTEENAVGDVITVSESFTNLYECCVSIAEGSDTGWGIYFDGINLLLICYKGEDKSKEVVFSTERDSLETGSVKDSLESYCNTVYIGGNGQGEEQTIYESENELRKGFIFTNNRNILVTEDDDPIILELVDPYGIERFESWETLDDVDDESLVSGEALRILNSYGKTLDLTGKGLVKSPYEFRKNFDLGDTIGIRVNNIFGKVPVIALTEHWVWGQYSLDYELGKPVIDLGNQLQLMLKKIQEGKKQESTESVKWYTLPDDEEMNSSETIYKVIGFKGDSTNRNKFKLYFNKESLKGSKTYHVYFKQLLGESLTLTTGVEGSQELELNTGTYTCIIFVDENGNVYKTI